MTQKTLNFLHVAYNEVAETPKTSNIIDILRELLDKLSDYNVPDEDSEDFDILIRNIETSIRVRQITFPLTTMVSDIVFVMMYIAIWANKHHRLNIDINIMARRKALESELTKFLEKGEVHDRFGIRGIVLNNDSEDDSIETQKLRFFCQYVVNILTKSNRKDCREFSDWITKSNLDDFTKQRISYILSIPFKVDRKKDYITDPKPNGYQSLHFVLMIEVYSSIRPGAEFELQFRTNRMHQEAVNGSSKHTLYKEQIDDSIKKVFTIDDFSKVNIVGFTSYNSSDDDIDGIHHAKSLFNRRISSTLVSDVQ
jgi:ppGpp synthetase/RelA/SpoT-type nucleotidyltranferase